MLYFVATPIGNLKDISYRAIEVLNSVDEIGCEDTRHSLTLLNHYSIKKPLFSYHKFNEKQALSEIIEKLKQGKNIAIISDAGMPVISDPGNLLTRALKEEGLEFTVVPGANAALSALILSGLDASRFCFIGFLPQKKSDRVELLEKFKKTPATLIFYSAPHDVKKDVESIYQVFGNRKAVAVKEITKIHENTLEFNLEEGINFEPKGEYVLIVDGYEEKIDLSVSPEELIDRYIKEGMDKKSAIKKVAKERDIPKTELYKYTIGK
ncbi:MAG: 16S rRNA (cytidine(1402)-2'-O)-methyltransferase [Clostridia bacterium]|nr:16S rRNA (cytidine(1402)-2'-O)-methyltransferase [Clostridia bacterium]MBQ7340537.1 16S rRNA (cytidine(1402)-2'-O)-methyltransferase [Clostridia bacterium]